MRKHLQFCAKPKLKTDILWAQNGVRKSRFSHQRKQDGFFHSAFFRSS
jgi:hypothetical protein